MPKTVTMKKGAQSIKVYPVDVKGWQKVGWGVAKEGDKKAPVKDTKKPAKEPTK